MILIDSHCHLNLLQEKDDLLSLIARANDYGVKYMLTVCTNLKELPAILETAEKHPNIFASCGVHPNDVKEIIDYQTIKDHCQHPKIIAIGETGLDYYHQPFDKTKQIASLEQHIIAAQSNGLPVIIHTREAEDDTNDILTSEMRNSSFSGVIHCFTASKDLARKMLNLGMYISIAGIVTFKNAEILQEIVRFLPLDRLLIETDSPYLSPIPMRGKQNEPAFVKYIAEKIAELKSITLEETANATFENFGRLFSKADFEQSKGLP